MRTLLGGGGGFDEMGEGTAPAIWCTEVNYPRIAGPIQTIISRVQLVNLSAVCTWVGCVQTVGSSKDSTSSMGKEGSISAVELDCITAGYI